jgi:hypothetical protein
MAAARIPPGLVVAGGLVGWAALALQFVLSMQLTYGQGRGTLDGIVSFLSFFTVLTNVLVVLAMTAPHLAPGTALGRFFARPAVATGVAAAIAIVGVIYVTLLRRVWDPQGAQLVADIVLHYVMPVMFVGYWWFGVDKHTLGWRDVSWYLVYPLAYLGVALLRGAVTGRYPYYFIDARELGYGQTAVNALGISLAFVAVSSLFTVVGRTQRSRP